MSKSNIRQYALKDSWRDWEIVLEVDHSKLNEERAAEINQFWSGDSRRLDEVDGDVVKAAIKLAAETLVTALLKVGGGRVNKSNIDGAGYWTRDDLHNEEGWGGTDDTPFGWCGIRLVSADVEVGLSLEFEGES
jgi:hypothetical protein